MYKPSLKSIWSLAALAVISLILYYIAQNSYSSIKAESYDNKIAAANHMKECMEVLREEFDRLDYTIDTTNDPNETGLIGLSGSIITTSRGILEDKITQLNPNFAAVYVDLLQSIRVSPGDYIAVGTTGANPGLNLALYSAAHILDINLVVIPSVGSAMFGANREEFTWLDMEKVLYDNGLINHRSVAASIGGGGDIGRGLPIEGREHIEQKVKGMGITLIYTGDLSGNKQQRMEIFDQHLPERTRYRAFINVGGGLANVGATVNANLLRDGIYRHLAERTFATEGVMMIFGRRNIPVIHTFRPSALAERYGLVEEPIPFPEIGEGDVFVTVVNNVTTATICLIILLVLIIAVIIFDRYDRHFTTNIIDPDQELL